eukprot:scaffold144234_cov18-Prasinocladus_malaysianus.AAC.1
MQMVGDNSRAATFGIDLSLCIACKLHIVFSSLQAAVLMICGALPADARRTFRQTRSLLKVAADSRYQNGRDTWRD